MTDVNTLHNEITVEFSDWITRADVALGELTVEVKAEHLLALCKELRDRPAFQFNQLMDICGLDYLHYGFDDWETETVTSSGFARGVMSQCKQAEPNKPNRFAVVYHLLSLTKNHRLRLRVNIPNETDLMVDSVMSIWPAADWFEREAFDLFGILFKGHPDLRRLLTDYGFVGHPFRKDFPLIGKVEARFDALLGRVIYEPVSIKPRTLEPKVIRHDNRYMQSDERSPHGE